MPRFPLAVWVTAFLLAGCETKVERSVTTPTPPSAPSPPNEIGPAPPATNEPPTLAIKVQPHRGPAPLDVNVNMCPTRDPDGEPLTFEYKWGGTGHRKVTTSCREDHTYEAAGTFKAFFCADDGHDHPACAYQLIVVD